MISVRQSAFVPGALERSVTAATCALLCLATLSIAITPEWPLQLMQAAIVALFAGFTVSRTILPTRRAWAIGFWGLLFVPCWGVVQIVLGQSSYQYATVTYALQWFSLWAVFAMFAACFAQSVILRGRVLNTYTAFATAVAVLVIANGLFTPGYLLGWIPTQYPQLIGPFQYYNNAAAFLELALPVSLYCALRDESKAQALAAGLLYSAVLVTASRTGAILATTETLAVVGIAMVRTGTGWRTLLPLRLAAIVTVAIVCVAGLLVGQRFEQENPLQERMQINRSSLQMAIERPVSGFGLGTYPIVYPAYARFDVGRYVNHAHNDWAEWAADGGFPLLIALALVAAVALPPALRSGWGIGLVAVFAHALVDYPFQRFGVSAWTMVILAAVLTDSRDRSVRTRRPA